MEPVLLLAAVVEVSVVVVEPWVRLGHLGLEKPPRFRSSSVEQLLQFVVEQQHCFVVGFWLDLELLAPIGELQSYHQKWLVQTARV